MTNVPRGEFLAIAAFAMPLLTGAEGGCGPAFSETPAPSMSGEWNVEYADEYEVEVDLGGAVYTEQLGVRGGRFDITHEGKPLSFDLSCDRDEVVCPSEIMPTEVSFRQDDERFPHRIFLRVPKTECDGMLVDPEPDACGEDTPNPDCEQVCDGDVTTVQREAFGTIDEAGRSFDLLVGGGIATNGVNCILLGVSVAKGDLVTSGSAEGEDWRADEVARGEVVTGYGGGCLWAGDPDDDGQLEALVLGASLKITSRYTAMRSDR